MGATEDAVQAPFSAAGRLKAHLEASSYLLQSETFSSGLAGYRGPRLEYAGEIVRLVHAGVKPSSNLMPGGG